MAATGMMGIVEFAAGYAVHWGAVALLAIGLYTVATSGNLVKKVVGLNIFQSAVFLFYIAMGYAEDASAPIFAEGASRYSSPLPHVLILTAIVVSVATTALALALVVRVREAEGAIEEGGIGEGGGGPREGPRVG